MMQKELNLALELGRQTGRADADDGGHERVPERRPAEWARGEGLCVVFHVLAQMSGVRP